MINKLITIFGLSAQWRCLSYQIAKEGINIHCHYLWFFYENFYIPFETIHIKRCIRMMGIRMNYNVCQIALKNKNTIWMYCSYSEEDVIKFADLLTKEIRQKYAGQLNIS